MPDKEDLAAFIRSSFRSVWSFEIALLLKGRQRRWTPAEVVAALRASDLIVRHGVENLVAAGLVDTDVEGSFAYTPINHSVAELMDRAERLYRSRPDYVRRLIVTRETASLTAFANAFRLRDD